MSDFDLTVAEQELSNRFSIYNHVKLQLQKEKLHGLLPAPPSSLRFPGPDSKVTSMPDPIEAGSKTSTGLSSGSAPLPTKKETEFDNFIVPISPAPVVQPVTTKDDAVAVLRRRQELALAQKKQKDERDARIAAAHQAASASATANATNPTTRNSTNQGVLSRNRPQQSPPYSQGTSNILPPPPSGVVDFNGGNTFLPSPSGDSHGRISRGSATLATASTTNPEFIICGLSSSNSTTSTVYTTEIVKQRLSQDIGTGLFSVKLLDGVNEDSTTSTFSSETLKETPTPVTPQFLVQVASHFFLNKIKHIWNEKAPFGDGCVVHIHEQKAVAFSARPGHRTFSTSDSQGASSGLTSLTNRPPTRNKGYKDLDNVSLSVFGAKTNTTGLLSLPGAPSLPSLLPGALPTLPGALPTLPGALPTLPGALPLSKASNISAFPVASGLPSLPPPVSVMNSLGLPSGLPGVSTSGLSSLPGLLLGMPAMPGMSAMPGISSVSAASGPTTIIPPTPSISALLPTKKRKLTSYLDLYDDPEI